MQEHVLAFQITFLVTHRFIGLVSCKLFHGCLMHSFLIQLRIALEFVDKDRDESEENGEKLIVKKQGKIICPVS